jgi:hypothetical protein
MKQGCGGGFRLGFEKKLAAKIDTQIHQCAIFISRLGEF